MDLLNTKLDEKVTRNNARAILKQYKQIERISGKFIDLQSPTFYDMPKTQFKPDALEDKIIRKLDAEKECKEILRAWSTLGEREMEVLRLSHLLTNSKTVLQISFEIDYSVKTVERVKAEAYIQFAYAYKNGELLVWK